MRKGLSVAIPAGVLVLVGVAFVILEARRIPDWRTELDAYVQSNSSRAERITVQLAVRASTPWGFREDRAVPVIGRWPWTVVRLPYPPKEVVCVLLARDRQSAVGAMGERTHAVVFVAYHSDLLWNQGWVVHEGEGDPFAAPIREALESVGCDLDLDRFDPGVTRTEHLPGAVDGATFA